MTITMLQMIQTAVLLTLLREGMSSQLNREALREFSDVMNTLNNTTTQSTTSLHSDQFSSLDSTMENNSYLLQMRQRSRHHRIESLRSAILNSLGMDHPPSVSISPETRNSVLESLERFPGLSELLLTEDVTTRRCYSAACEIPHKVNETLWQDASSPGLRLFFPIPRDSNHNDELQSATLYLFLKPSTVRRSHYSCEEGDCLPMEEHLVSVYQFLRPLSFKRRVVSRRRLLDARFVPVSGNSWIAFNIGDVAIDWRQHRRNFGIEITVTDSNETEIAAQPLFVAPDCSIGREIGCREGHLEDGVRFPWFVDYIVNFPYVDITTLRNTPDIKRRKRATRRQGPYRNQLARYRSTARQQVQTEWSCAGKIVIIDLKDARVAEPKTFVSRVCPTTCWDCDANQQCTARACKPPDTQTIMGHYYTAEGGLTALAPLPFSRIVACGC